MKRDFLVTTGLIEGWEFNENNFLLGKWCEFYGTEDLSKEKIPKQISIVENIHHWEDKEKQIRDYEYLKKN